ncbi:MAG: exodeoxyribonuclease VII small subunit [Culicoidibacterales bacterium]
MVKTQSFEQSLQALEQIVKQLEQGEVELEQSIALFQEGMLLAQQCNKKLAAVEEQMATLVDENGQLKPFSLEADE